MTDTDIYDVCARLDEAGGLVQDLLKLDLPRDLRDVITLCDLRLEEASQLAEDLLLAEDDQ